jgi:hypothetical protein
MRHARAASLHKTDVPAAWKTPGAARPAPIMVEVRRVEEDRDRLIPAELEVDASFSVLTAPQLP